ncbi:retrovirus-related pol polyprotein from transposon TNT 1-94, partial [Tanacetum coccineum]
MKPTCLVCQPSYFGFCKYAPWNRHRSFSRPTSSFLAQLDHGLPGFQEAFNLLEEGSILSLEVNLSGDCDVEKNGKWSCIYADGSNEYHAVCTRPDIASANEDGVDRAKLKCVAVGATGALTKAVPGSRILPFKFLSTAIVLQTGVVAAQGLRVWTFYLCGVYCIQSDTKKMEIMSGFVAALGFIAVAFWVICLLFRICTNVIFRLLFLFTNASVRIYVHIFNNLLSMIREIPIEPNESLVKAGISKKRISKRGPLRLKLRKLKRKPKSVVGHISAIVTRNPCANGWYLDSGATVHVCDSRDKFVDYQKVTGKQVIMANSDRADVCGFGTVKLKFTSGKVVTLQNVYHVPSIPKCLISVSKLDEHGFKITFESRKVVISKHGVFVGKGYILGGMYRVDDSSGSVDEAFDSFKVYKAEVENQLGKRIKILRSDRGGEYFTGMFAAFCEENGIKHEPACHIHNRIISRVIPTSPYELWKGRKPNLDYVRVWGCVAYYRTPDPKRSKLGARGIRSVFVGYAKNSKAYRLLDERTCVIIESRDVDFFEDKFSNDVENSHAELVPTPCGSSHGETSTEINEPRQSIRARKEKDFGSDFFSYLVEGTQKKVTRKVIFTINIDDDPKTFSEAMSSHDAPMWKEAINDEMDSILGNQTWELAELPKGVRPIGFKWVFKKKLNPDGSISAFKARLVAKGYRQKEGIDYFDTYAPVARISSIRTLIAISAVKGLYIHQMDVKTALLNGYLNEEVYMEKPEGFVIQGQEKKVCILVKSLYGLKQAPKQWHERFDTIVTSLGFQHNSADRCIYTRSTKDYTVVICLYVDDMLIIGTTLDGILETKSYSSLNFKMKDLGEVDTILGVKVRRTNNQLSLSQSHYINKILTKFRHLDIKECNTPFDTSVKLEAHSGRAVPQLEYVSVIGSLMYAMHLSRVLGYLKRTSALQLTYTSYLRVLEGYSDASWINHSGDSKSTSGWIYTLARGAISWASKKQTCISHSTMEAEFIALAAAGKEAEWIRDFKAALSIAYNSVYNGKSRHLRLQRNYVRQLVENGTISVVYVKSCRNLADPLTKPLTRDLAIESSGQNRYTKTNTYQILVVTIEHFLSSFLSTAVALQTGVVAALRYKDGTRDGFCCCTWVYFCCVLGRLVAVQLEHKCLIHGVGSVYRCITK